MEIKRTCFRQPIPEIFQAANMLEDSLSELRKWNYYGVKELIMEANLLVIREWAESIWGSKSPYIQYRNIDNSLPLLKKS